MPPNGTRITRLGKVSIREPLLTGHVEGVSSPRAILENIGPINNMIWAEVRVGVMVIWGPHYKVEYITLNNTQDDA